MGGDAVGRPHTPDTNCGYADKFYRVLRFRHDQPGACLLLAILTGGSCGRGSDANAVLTTVEQIRLLPPDQKLSDIHVHLTGSLHLRLPARTLASYKTRPAVFGFTFRRAPSLPKPPVDDLG